METYGEWSKVEQLKRNTGNKSQDSEENSSIEAGLNVKMSAFFQASFKVGGHMLWRPTHDLSPCTIFICCRLTCVLKPLGLWKHIVNGNIVNYEKIRSENWRRSTNFFWIEMAVHSENEIDVLFVGKCRFQTAANQNKLFFACLDFVLIIDFRARFDSKIKCCRAVFGLKKRQR